MKGHAITRSDQVLSLWKGFGVEDDRAMLAHLKALGESMGATESGPQLKHQVHRMQGGYSDEMRLKGWETVLYIPYL